MGTRGLSDLNFLTAWNLSIMEIWYKFQYTALREKCLNTELFLVRILTLFDWIRRGIVFSPNEGKYGPEITPYLDTFNAVLKALTKKWIHFNHINWHRRSKTDFLGPFIINYLFIIKMTTKNETPDAKIIWLVNFEINTIKYNQKYLIWVILGKFLKKTIVIWNKYCHHAKPIKTKIETRIPIWIFLGQNSKKTIVIFEISTQNLSW